MQVVELCNLVMEPLGSLVVWRTARCSHVGTVQQAVKSTGDQTKTVGSI